jgi:hypothetical protein
MILHRITSDNAQQIWTWFQNRGGISVWKSADLSDPGKSWTTPANDAEGKPIGKQHWKMQDAPSLTITDPAQVAVDVGKEVKRFRVSVRVGGNGLALKCTDASSARIRKALEKAGPDSWYEFDYENQEAVIFAPGESLPLLDFVAREIKS